MLKLINTEKHFPISNPYSRRAYFVPGMFGELNRKGIIIVSKGKNPCGIIDDLKTPTKTTTIGGDVSLWVTPGIFETDVFEKSGKYEKWTILYISPAGKLTSRRRKNSRAMGYVKVNNHNCLRFQYNGWEDRPKLITGE